MTEREPLSPTLRTLRAKLAAHTLHATHDPKETTRAARAAFNARFDREVDPNGELADAERRRRAGHAKQAYFTRMALKSAKARAARKKPVAPVATDGSQPLSPS